MKKYLLTIAIFINGLITFAQTPTSFQYQAVLRDALRYRANLSRGKGTRSHDKIVRQQWGKLAVFSHSRQFTASVKSNKE